MGGEINRPAAELLTERVGDALAALDIAGDEAQPLEPFALFLRRWKDAGKGLTIHAGEAPAGEGGRGAAGVLEAVEVYGAQRIGHGVRAAEDPAVIKRLLSAGVTLELCPTSNLQTRAVGSPQLYPLSALLRAGVRTTVNADDPTICGVTLRDEWRTVLEWGLSLDELRACMGYAADAAFTDAQTRARLHAAASAFIP
jgi:adenosine deaminase